MKNFKSIFFTSILFGVPLVAWAQTDFQAINMGNFIQAPNIIPDKFWEMLVPVVLIFVLLNIIVTILKNVADNRLKQKLIDKGISDDNLVQIFKENNKLSKLRPLKYFLFSLALALSFLTIYLLEDYLDNQSGYLAVSIILFFTSIAFFIYYKKLNNKSDEL